MKFFFCIFFIILFISKTENVFSNNLIYDVNNVEIKGNINSSFTNTNLIEAAFKKAFIVFANKTLLKKDAVSLYETKSKTIKDLVFTYQIKKKETNSNKETLLILNIKFDSKKINNFLAQRRIPYADISNISITLLPILIKEREIFLYEENFFYKNWNKSRNKKKNINEALIINYNLALESIEDLEYINKFKKNIDLINIKKINSFYGSDNYALLIIYSTDDEFKAFIKTSIKDKDVDRNINLKIYPSDEKKAYVEAISNIKSEINQIWKEQNLIDVNTPSFLDFFLEIKKTNDYLKVKNILDSIDIIENYSVLEMTNSYFKIRLKYRGKVSKIKNKLMEQKIDIQIIDNIWKLKIN